MVGSYEMDFMKGNVILVKGDEMNNILKSASHSLFVESISFDDQSFCWSLLLNVHTFTTSLLYEGAGFIL